MQDSLSEHLQVKKSCDLNKLQPESWARVIRRFTECQLTMGEDRLVAISDSDRRFSEALNDVYVAGLWENRLPRDLLWCVVL